jgi:hypothetical protein
VEYVEGAADDDDDLFPLIKRLRIHDDDGGPLDGDSHAPFIIQKNASVSSSNHDNMSHHFMNMNMNMKHIATSPLRPALGISNWTTESDLQGRLVQSPIQLFGRDPFSSQPPVKEEEEEEEERVYLTKRNKAPAASAATMTTTTTTTMLPPPPPPPPCVVVEPAPPPPPPPLRMLQQVAEQLRQSILQEHQQQKQQIHVRQNIRQTPPSTPMQWAKSLLLPTSRRSRGCDSDSSTTTTMPSMPHFTRSSQEDEDVDEDDNTRVKSSTQWLFRWIQALSKHFADAALATTPCTTSSSSWLLLYSSNKWTLLVILCISLASAASLVLLPSSSRIRQFLPVSFQRFSSPAAAAQRAGIRTNQTLRTLLTHPDGFSLAMAPAFFGFYGYFGALAAWEEAFATTTNSTTDASSSWYPQHVRSVAGASAGAMAAILLAAGVSPQAAIDFCTNVTLHQFADFPGMGAMFRGDKFEQLMSTFLLQQQQQLQHSTISTSLRLEHSIIPVAVSAFDLQTWQGQVLTHGSMAKAARASATFPLLFQPVPWRQSSGGEEEFLLIDGGVTDVAGIQGLLALLPATSKRLIVNMVVGDFFSSTPPGPRTVPELDQNGTVFLSIRIQNLPQCGPWAMQNGPRAVEAARRAMLASLDVPLMQIDDRHLSIRIDASSFLPTLS